MDFSVVDCSMLMLSVITVPAFEDNYLWLIHNGAQAAVVDPGDAAPILAALAANDLSLVAILLTHHHADHIGGVPELLKRYHIPVYGPRHENIPHVTHPLSEGDIAIIAELDLAMSVLDAPGHTRGHITYYSASQHWLFCGDTLFGGGCGRLFEGTPAQMASSLEKLAALPDETQVYCAHEYTLANLRFALEVEPGNQILALRMQVEQEKRRHGQPTIPSTIGQEKATNPFLRYAEPVIGKHLLAAGRVNTLEPLNVFTALREWKNVYR